MQIFIDTADELEVRHWSRYGVVDGVTTNPSLLLAQRWTRLQNGVVRLANAIHPRPLSVEVFADEDHEMLAQARTFAGWADNIVIKVPVIDGDGRPLLEVVHRLESEGVRVNCTACMSFGQAALAAKAGATYVSLLAGRIDDEGNDGSGVVGQTCSWLRDWGMPSRVIAGSIRAPRDVQRLAAAGVHVITVPPPILTKLVDHRYSRATSAQFTRDGQQAFGQVLIDVG
ncbi:transaldolase family protein [Actinomadura rubrisoli]|uniref:Transaldolase n=1 Tax=Actinomadura rubrisoli TaxID=2530368 RepID=A0A4V2YZE0_9ACTN|nr:transaldolase family protein [Actinomadura rubrisoli]TDD96797.1 transaldolase [Actinomadura rubrisoli]